MTLPGRRPATYADIETLPEHLVGEILNGELVVNPRPAPRHANASTVLGGLLVPPFGLGDRGPGGWWILAEPEIHIGEHVVVPDLAGWRRERMPSMPEEAFFSVPPDWVCEVLSPSTSKTDKIVKRPIYAEFGVSHLWLVDPIDKTLEVSALDAGRWVLVATHGGDEAVRAVPFDAVALDLKHLWLAGGAGE
jgi:Uma2 family endonuclease